MTENNSVPATEPKTATSKRVSDRETEVTRTFHAPVHLVFDAWSKAELFKQWWVPKSFGLTLASCEMDVRIGGGYRLEFNHPDFAQPMAFFGTYTDVIPNARITWTNEESDEGAVTTVTFAQEDDKTKVTVHDLYPSKEILDAEIASGATGGLPETLTQLAEFLAGS